jgi:FkbM family methyltransferase
MFVISLLSGDSEPVLKVRGVGEGLLQLDIRHKTQRQMYLEVVYEPQVFNYIVTYLKPGMVFVDVGANVGYYTVAAGCLVGEKGCVLAFEPEKKNRARLKANLTRNNLKNVHVFSEALSNMKGAALLYLNEENEGGHSLLSERGGITESVFSTVFDELLRSVSSLCRGVDLIKIDVEGFEKNVLQGMKGTLQHHEPAVVCEVSSNHQEVFDFMHDLGFSASTFSAEGLIPCRRPVSEGARDYLFTRAEKSR